MLKCRGTSSRKTSNELSMPAIGTLAVGRRDHAIILLLARLGLRASEVIALELDDIDWRAGVLTVRGKGRYHDRLPLPPDVGEAIASTCANIAQHCTTRRRFHPQQGASPRFCPPEFRQYDCLPRIKESRAATRPQGGTSPATLPGHRNASSRGVHGRDRRDSPPPRRRTPRRSTRKWISRAFVRSHCPGPRREVSNEQVT